MFCQNKSDEVQRSKKPRRHGQTKILPLSRTHRLVLITIKGERTPTGGSYVVQTHFPFGETRMRSEVHQVDVVSVCVFSCSGGCYEYVEMFCFCVCVCVCVFGYSG